VTYVVTYNTFGLIVFHEIACSMQDNSKLTAQVVALENLFVGHIEYLFTVLDKSKQTIADRLNDNALKGKYYCSRWTLK
jgi:hypothetical protein